MNIKKFIKYLFKMLNTYTHAYNLKKVHCDDEKLYSQRIKRVTS